jgi:hypothetical protein
MQKGNCDDAKLVRLAKIGKDDVACYVATRWGVTVAHAKKYITQYVIADVRECPSCMAVSYLVPRCMLLQFRTCRSMYLHNKNFGKNRMNASQLQALEDWRDKNSSRFAAMKQAIKERKPLGAWREVRSLYVKLRCSHACT